jgi:hypothetical protein
VFGVTGCGSDDDVDVESRVKNVAPEASGVSDALSKADCDLLRSDYLRDVVIDDGFELVKSVESLGLSASEDFRVPDSLRDVVTGDSHRLLSDLGDLTRNLYDDLREIRWNIEQRPDEVLEASNTNAVRYLYVDLIYLSAVDLDEILDSRDDLDGLGLLEFRLGLLEFRLDLDVLLDDLDLDRLGLYELGELHDVDFSALIDRLGDHIDQCVGVSDLGATAPEGDDVDGG